MKRKKRVQYHPAFCAAAELELRENKEELTFYEELAVNVKPRQIDLVVVKEPKGAGMKSGLGAIFKKYNLFEYKSPNQALGLDQYYKALACATFLEERQHKIEKCSREDFTLSFVRAWKPRDLMEQLEQTGFRIVQFQPGIYHVTRRFHIDMQIIVTSRLGEEYQWLTKLTNRLERADMERLYEAADNLSDQADRSRAETVLDLAMELNRNKEWMKKEDHIMGALRDMFKEEFEMRDQKIEELQKQLQSQNKQLQSQNKQLQDKDEQLQDKDEQLQIQNEQLQDKDEQLQDKDEQLQNKDAQIIQLKEELEKLRKLFGDNIAML